MNGRLQFAAFFVLMMCATPALAQNKLPTDQDLQQMFDRKEYRACLQQTARVLALRPDLAAAYDPYTLLMRRGECLVNLGDGSSAVSAYTAAVPVAKSPQDADQARAMVTLLKASRGVNYIPKPGADPINIVAPETRKQAMSALFALRWSAAADQIAAAQNATTLVPLMNFVPLGRELHALEFAGTGTDDTSRPVLLACGERARTLITTELKTLNEKIAAIKKRSDTLLASGYTSVNVNGQEWWAADTRLGLTADDREQLRVLIGYLTDVVAVSEKGKDVAISFGRDGAVWDPVIGSAQESLRTAQSVLAAE